MPANENEAERKIYFFQILPEDPNDVPSDWGVDRAELAERIALLKGTPEFYFEEYGERITCAEVHKATKPPAVKFYAIRRTNLPSKDDGGGVIGDLGLAAEEGLAEAVHLVFFKNGIVGFESFFYGPRIGRIEAFLNENCAEAFHGHRIVVKQLYRGDMLERALAFKDIRLFHVKLPADATPSEARQANLEKILETATRFHTRAWAEVTFRSEAHDATFTDRVKSILRRMRKDEVDPATILQKLDIQGTNPETGKVEPLDLLSDALQRVAMIPRASARTRALDSDAAFKAVRDAYRQVEDELPTDMIEA